MLIVHDAAAFLEEFAPPALAETWDNVGLLVGDRQSPVRRIMTCLTVTPASAAEALEREADLIVVHHPLPFQALKRITTDTPQGQLLWKLMRAGTSVYSPHTAFDSAPLGINQRLAEGLGLAEIRVLVPKPSLPRIAAPGAGRVGDLAPPQTLAELARKTKEFLKIEQVQVVGSPDASLRRVAIGCGSAGEFLGPAREAGCDGFVTGEARFHTALEAEATGVALILAGHYATERFAVELLAGVLAEKFSDVDVWASQREADPLRWA